MPFLDSNVVLYAYTQDDKSIAAKAILLEGAIISVQTLNEFTNVARKKLGFEWAEVTVSIGQIKSLCAPVLAMSEEIHDKARAIAERYRLPIYDANVIAAALSVGCDTLYSEDMQHGLVIEDRMTIRNPFL
jgi:predicted nucleic acid-binding protein